MAVITYKCPSCGGRLEFDSALQKMLCPFCGSTFAVSDFADQDQAALGVPEAAAAAIPGSEATVAATPGSDAPAPPDPGQRVDWMLPSRRWAPAEQADMYVYTCSTCAGQLVADQTLGTTACPYCGNPVTITERFAGDLKPDLVLPFKLDKNAAMAAFGEHCKGKPYLPTYFTAESRISEIKGVYVPFWLFDATCQADADYNCTKVRHYSDSDYEYTETDHFTVQRKGTVQFLHVPVDGSQRLADDLMESIEPFDYSQLVPFQTAYLAGYSANIYDVDAPTAIRRAQQRMAGTTDEVMRTSVTAYSTIELRQMDLDFMNPRCHYALLPVWLLSTVFDNKTYTFAMNGQSGCFVGDLPVDRGRVAKGFISIAAVVWPLAFIAWLVMGWLGG